MILRVPWRRTDLLPIFGILLLILSPITSAESAAHNAKVNRQSNDRSQSPKTQHLVAQDHQEKHNSDQHPQPLKARPVAQNAQDGHPQHREFPEPHKTLPVKKESRDRHGEQREFNDRSKSEKTRPDVAQNHQDESNADDHPKHLKAHPDAQNTKDTHRPQRELTGRSESQKSNPVEKESRDQHREQREFSDRTKTEKAQPGAAQAKKVVERPNRQFDQPQFPKNRPISAQDPPVGEMMDRQQIKYPEAVWKLEQSAKPGVTFPVLQSVVKTNFTCRDKKGPGWYSDLETGCQQYHRCYSATRSTAFICPPETLFSQETLVCDFWYNVNCSAARGLFEYANSRLYKLGVPLHGDANWTALEIERKKSLLTTPARTTTFRTTTTTTAVEESTAEETSEPEATTTTTRKKPITTRRPITTTRTTTTTTTEPEEEEVVTEAPTTRATKKKIVVVPIVVPVKTTARPLTTKRTPTTTPTTTTEAELMGEEDSGNSTILINGGTPIIVRFTVNGVPTYFYYVTVLQANGQMVPMLVSGAPAGEVNAAITGTVLPNPAGPTVIRIVVRLVNGSYAIVPVETTSIGLLPDGSFLYVLPHLYNWQLIPGSVIYVTITFTYGANGSITGMVLPDETATEPPVTAVTPVDTTGNTILLNGGVPMVVSFTVNGVPTLFYYVNILLATGQMVPVLAYGAPAGSAVNTSISGIVIPNPAGPSTIRIIIRLTNGSYAVMPVVTNQLGSLPNGNVIHVLPYLYNWQLLSGSVIYITVKFSYGADGTITGMLPEGEATVPSAPLVTEHVTEAQVTTAAPAPVPGRMNIFIIPGGAVTTEAPSETTHTPRSRRRRSSTTTASVEAETEPATADQVTTAAPTAKLNIVVIPVAVPTTTTAARTVRTTVTPAPTTFRTRVRRSSTTTTSRAEIEPETTPEETAGTTISPVPAKGMVIIVPAVVPSTTTEATTTEETTRRSRIRRSSTTTTTPATTTTTTTTTTRSTTRLTTAAPITTAVAEVTKAANFLVIINPAQSPASTTTISSGSQILEEASTDAAATEASTAAVTTEETTRRSRRRRSSTSTTEESTISTHAPVVIPVVTSAPAVTTRRPTTTPAAPTTPAVAEATTKWSRRTRWTTASQEATTTTPSNGNAESTASEAFVTRWAKRTARWTTAAAESATTTEPAETTRQTRRRRSSTTTTTPAPTPAAAIFIAAIATVPPTEATTKASDTVDKEMRMLEGLLPANLTAPKPVGNMSDQYTRVIVVQLPADMDSTMARNLTALQVLPIDRNQYTSVGDFYRPNWTPFELQSIDKLGVPGVMYPAYRETVRTSFTCVGKRAGWYADSETRCQQYHFCHANGTEGTDSPLMCPIGTLFSQLIQTCVVWYDVACSGIGIVPSAAVNVSGGISAAATPGAGTVNVIVLVGGQSTGAVEVVTKPTVPVTTSAEATTEASTDAPTTVPEVPVVIVIKEAAPTAVAVTEASTVATTTTAATEAPTTPLKTTKTVISNIPINIAFVGGSVTTAPEGTTTAAPHTVALPVIILQQQAATTTAAAEGTTRWARRTRWNAVTQSATAAGTVAAVTEAPTTRRSRRRFATEITTPETTLAPQTTAAGVNLVVIVPAAAETTVAPETTTETVVTEATTLAPVPTVAVDTGTTVAAASGVNIVIITPSETTTEATANASLPVGRAEVTNGTMFLNGGIVGSAAPPVVLFTVNGTPKYFYYFTVVLANGHMVPMLSYGPSEVAASDGTVSGSVVNPSITGTVTPMPTGPSTIRILIQLNNGSYAVVPVETNATATLSNGTVIPVLSHLYVSSEVPSNSIVYQMFPFIYSPEGTVIPWIRNAPYTAFAPPAVTTVYSSGTAQPVYYIIIVLTNGTMLPAYVYGAPPLNATFSTRIEPAVNATIIGSVSGVVTYPVIIYLSTGKYATVTATANASVTLGNGLTVPILAEIPDESKVTQNSVIYNNFPFEYSENGTIIPAVNTPPVNAYMPPTVAKFTVSGASQPLYHTSIVFQNGAIVPAFAYGAAGTTINGTEIGTPMNGLITPTAAPIDLVILIQLSNGSYAHATVQANATVTMADGLVVPVLSHLPVDSDMVPNSALYNMYPFLYRIDGTAVPIVSIGPSNAFTSPVTTQVTSGNGTSQILYHVTVVASNGTVLPLFVVEAPNVTAVNSSQAVATTTAATVVPSNVTAVPVVFDNPGASSMTVYIKLSNGSFAPVTISFTSTAKLTDGSVVPVLLHVPDESLLNVTDLAVSTLPFVYSPEGQVLVSGSVSTTNVTIVPEVTTTAIESTTKAGVVNIVVVGGQATAAEAVTETTWRRRRNTRKPTGTESPIVPTAASVTVPQETSTVAARIAALPVVIVSGNAAHTNVSVLSNGTAVVAVQHTGPTVAGGSSSISMSFSSNESSETTAQETMTTTTRGRRTRYRTTGESTTSTAAVATTAHTTKRGRGGAVVVAGGATTTRAPGGTRWQRKMKSSATVKPTISEILTEAPTTAPRWARRSRWTAAPETTAAVPALVVESTPAPASTSSVNIIIVPGHIEPAQETAVTVSPPGAEETTAPANISSVSVLIVPLAIQPSESQLAANTTEAPKVIWFSPEPEVATGAPGRRTRWRTTTTPGTTVLGFVEETTTTTPRGRRTRYRTPGTTAEDVPTIATKTTTRTTTAAPTIPLVIVSGIAGGALQLNGTGGAGSTSTVINGTATVNATVPVLPGQKVELIVPENAANLTLVIEQNTASPTTVTRAAGETVGKGDIMQYAILNVTAAPVATDPATTAAQNGSVVWFIPGEFEPLGEEASTVTPAPVETTPAPPGSGSLTIITITNATAPAAPSGVRLVGVTTIANETVNQPPEAVIAPPTIVTISGAEQPLFNTSIILLNGTIVPILAYGAATPAASVTTAANGTVVPSAAGPIVLAILVPLGNGQYAPATVETNASATLPDGTVVPVLAHLPSASDIVPNSMVYNTYPFVYRADGTPLQTVNSVPSNAFAPPVVTQVTSPNGTAQIMYQMTVVSANGTIVPLLAYAPTEGAVAPTAAEAVPATIGSTVITSSATPAPVIIMQPTMSELTVYIKLANGSFVPVLVTYNSTATLADGTMVPVLMRLPDEALLSAREVAATDAAVNALPFVYSPQGQVLVISTGDNATVTNAAAVAVVTPAETTAAPGGESVAIITINTQVQGETTQAPVIFLTERTPVAVATPTTTPAGIELIQIVSIANETPPSQSVIVNIAPAAMSAVPQAVTVTGADQPLYNASIVLLNGTIVPVLAYGAPVASSGALPAEDGVFDLTMTPVFLTVLVPLSNGSFAPATVETNATVKLPDGTIVPVLTHMPTEADIVPRSQIFRTYPFSYQADGAPVQTFSTVPENAYLAPIATQVTGTNGTAETMYQTTVISANGTVIPIMAYTTAVASDSATAQAVPAATEGTMVVSNASAASTPVIVNLSTMSTITAYIKLANGSFVPVLLAFNSTALMPDGSVVPILMRLPDESLVSASDVAVNSLPFVYSSDGQVLVIAAPENATLISAAGVSLVTQETTTTGVAAIAPGVILTGTGSANQPVLTNASTVNVTVITIGEPGTTTTDLTNLLIVPGMVPSGESNVGTVNITVIGATEENATGVTGVIGQFVPLITTTAATTTTVGPAVIVPIIISQAVATAAPVAAVAETTAVPVSSSGVILQNQPGNGSVTVNVTSIGPGAFAGGSAAISGNGASNASIIGLFGTSAVPLTGFNRRILLPNATRNVSIVPLWGQETNSLLGFGGEAGAVAQPIQPAVDSNDINMMSSMRIVSAGSGLNLPTASGLAVVLPNGTASVIPMPQGVFLTAAQTPTGTETPISINGEQYVTRKYLQHRLIVKIGPFKNLNQTETTTAAPATRSPFSFRQLRRLGG